MRENKKIMSLLFFIAAAGIVQFAGSLFTFEAVINWYPSLNKPAFNPPSWIFAPVWTILYLLIALSGWLVWKKREEKKSLVDFALTAYSLQLFLNVLWSYLFFQLRSPAAGMAGIIFLWAAIVWNMNIFRKISKKAFYLLAPYLAWVSFAAILNFAVWRLNA
ncbi:MAG: TspO/MBR family protein [Candidatus Paceibacterota bacterium]|jgi:tryptophan-rich sensory protein